MQPGNTKVQQENQSSQKGLEKQQAKDENVTAAHEQAEADIEQDPDYNSEPDPTADLDEGEIARLDNGNDEKLDI